MEKTKKFAVTAIAILLVLSMFITCLNLGFAASQEPNSSTESLSAQTGFSSLQVQEHKITSSELETLKNGIGVRQEGKNYNQLVNGHGTGLSPPTAENWVDIAQNGKIVDSVTAINTPPTVDNSATPWFPPIGNQDGEGSCATWATGYYVKTYQEAKEHNWDLSGAAWEGGYYGNPTVSYQNKIISPEFIYHLVNYGVDTGTSFEDAINLINNVGACMWQNMPYDPTNHQSWPTEAAWTQAAQYRGNSTFGYQYIYANTTSGISNVKSLLADGNLVVFALDAYQYPHLTPQDVMTADNYNSAVLNHANTIVGYNDTLPYMENGTEQHGAFKIANSWGIGSSNWEHINDGFYWMSYACMEKISVTENPCIIFQDLSGYQPQLLATFRINHNYRGDCQITFGLGTVSAPLATKRFDNYVLGGNGSFCTNNIVFDITEFKSRMTSPYNQPFFMRIYDRGLPSGNIATGSVTFFAVGSTSSTQPPVNTVNNGFVNLTLTYSTAPPALTVSPAFGPPSGSVTLNGLGFAFGASVDLTYLDPLTSCWIPIADNIATAAGAFNYVFNTPDFHQNNPTGDNAPSSDAILFQAKDNIGGELCNATYQQMRRGLSWVADSEATGLYGNNTDLARAVFVSNGQNLLVSGKYFRAGSATLLWDGTTLNSTLVSSSGDLNTSIIVPETSAGKHTLVIRDQGADFAVNVSRTPKTNDDYSPGWHNSSFTINLASDFEAVAISYKINNQPTASNVSDGQPQVTTESASNTLEYWGIWDIYGTGSMELNHVTITGVKLDKTAPTGSITSASTTDTTTVALTLSASDAVSGVSQMRFSNDGSTWTNWEPYATTKTWSLPVGNGQKTVFAQYMDNAGLTSLYNCTINLYIPDPTPTPTQTIAPTTQPTQSPAPPIPELNLQITLVLLAVSTLMLTAAVKRLKK